MKTVVFLIVFGLCFATETSASTAKRIKIQTVKRKTSFKRVIAKSIPRTIPSYEKSPLSQKQNVPMEDAQIRGLKSQIQKNSKELNHAKWFLDEAYIDGVVPLARELSDISGKISDKRMKGLKVSKLELKEKRKAKRYLIGFKKWIKPLEIRSKKLEKENKALSATLYQYILVAN